MENKWGPLFSYELFPNQLNADVMQLQSICQIQHMVPAQESKIKVVDKAADSLQILLPTNCKEGIYVHLCWVYIWCFTLSYQDEKETIFRMNQVKQILKNLKAQYRFNFKPDLYYVIIRSCYYHSNFKVCDAIFN